MKTHIIQLERYDDVTSVADKIAGSRANRVLLVWPRRGRVLARPLDLVLIQRACTEIGAQLACLVEDEDILDHAQELGIPVFRTVKTAQRMLWRRPRHKKQVEPRALRPRSELDEARLASRPGGAAWPGMNWLRCGLFGVGVVALLGVLLLVLPSARIGLRLQQSQQTIQLPVYASPNLTSLNLSGGLPVRYLMVVLEGQDEQNTTGKVWLGDKAAQAEVKFTNLTDLAVVIPAGTRLQTQAEMPVQFETRREARLSARPGATTLVEVQAVQPGSLGNVAAETIQAVVGEIGTRVKVTNPAAALGGRDLLTPAVAPEDVAILRQRLNATLRQQARQELAARLAPGQRVFPDTLEVVRIFDEKQVPAVGTAADRVSLGFKMELRVWTVQQSDLEALAQVALDSSLPPGSTGLNDSLRISDTSEPVLEQDQLRWQVQAERTLQAGWDGRRLVEAVAGQSVEAARQALARQIRLVQPPVIEMTPAWWPVFPLLPGRIEVVVQ